MAIACVAASLVNFNDQFKSSSGGCALKLSGLPPFWAAKLLTYVTYIYNTLQKHHLHSSNEEIYIIHNIIMVIYTDMFYTGNSVSGAS